MKNLLPIIVAFCGCVVIPILLCYFFYMFFNSELIVDKVHYGILMIASLILIHDITNDMNNKSPET